MESEHYSSENGAEFLTCMSVVGSSVILRCKNKVLLLKRFSKIERVNRMLNPSLNFEPFEYIDI